MAAHWQNLYSGNFIPHGHCYLWKPGLVWLHILSDASIALAYYSIPLVLVYFVRLRRDIPFSWIFLLFGAFIIACGTGHLMEVWTVWHPDYWLAGGLKAFTALVSLYTAVMLVPLIPQALALPNPAQLEAANRQLEQEIRDRAKAEEQLSQTTAELQAIFYALPDLYFRIAADGTILDCNAGRASELYLTPEKFLGKRIRDVLSPAVGEQVDWAIGQVFHQSVGETPRAAVQMEYSLQMPAGEKNYEARLLPLLDNQIIGIVRDITPAKQAEAALRSSEERFRRIFADAPIGMVLVRTDNYRIVQVNRALCEMLGYTESELTAMAISQITQPEDADKLVSLAEQIANGDRPSYQIEKRYLKKNQEIVWGNLTLTLIRDSVGQVLYALGMIEDITERKIASLNLRSSQQMLQLVIDNIPQFIFWKDRNSVFLGCNQNFARVAGVGSPEHIVGKTDYDLAWKPEEADFFRECDRRVMETGTPEYHIPETQLQANNKQAWLDTNKIPLRDAGGFVVGILGTYEDITERRRSEARFQKLAANVPGVIYQLLVGADGSMSVLYVSPGCRQLYELEPEEFQKTLGYELIHPDDLQSIGETIAVCSSTLKPWNWLGRLVTRSGQLKWVQGVARPELQPNGDILWDGLVIDITKRKQAEEQVEFQARLLDAVEQAAIATDLSGKITYWNRFAQELYGWQSAEVIGRDIVEVTVAQTSQTQVEELMSRLSSGESWSGEFFVKRRDGTFFPVMATDSPIYDAKGTLVGVIGVSQDITERKQAEEALRLSEARYRTLAQQEELLNRLAGQIRNSLDIDTILETAVREIRNLLQIDKCLFLWYRRDLPSFPSVNGRAEGRFWEVVKEAKNADMSSFLGCFSADHQPTLVRKLLNLEMLRVDDMTTATEPELQEMYVSFGYTALLTLPIQMRSGNLGLVSCGHFSGTRPWRDNEVELLEAVTLQLAIAVSQAELYAQAQDAARIAQSKARELELTLHELQKTQAQLIQSEKMSSLGQMVAGVAHEINNPVNFISGNLTYANDYTQKLLDLVQLYQQQYPPNEKIKAVSADIDLDFLVEDLPKLLSSMKVGADRIRQIVLSLRNFSRLDEAEMKLVDIHEGIDSTLLILQNRLKDNGRRCGIEVVKEYGQLPLVECYAGQLNQVFMNILSNAIDALEASCVQSPASKVRSPKSRVSLAVSLSIRIRTEVLEGDSPNGDRSETRVAIRIADNGPGIPEKILGRIFDPFFTTKPVGAGTGLGLSISYQIIVEKHKGELKCVSTPGSGTEFVIDIPSTQRVQEPAVR